MKAIVMNEFGGPHVLAEQEVPIPELIPGHVRVRVRASSVNPVDTKIRSGLLAAIAPESPAILGCDMAGVVEAVGEGVTEFAAGDEVYGCAGGVKGCPGALAEYQMADVRLIARKPASLSMEEAAALPLVGITAWDALMDRSRVSAGQRVLVHGATGGVGHIGIQLAKAAGARVYTTGSSEEKLTIARGLGADVGINYRDSSVEDYVCEQTDGKGFDVVFDTIGGGNLQGCFHAAAMNGTVASISTRCTCDLTPFHQKALTMHVTFMLIPMLYGQGRERHGEILRELAAMADAGTLKPLIDRRRFRFDQAADAHALLESGQAIGKVVLTGF